LALAPSEHCRRPHPATLQRREVTPGTTGGLVVDASTLRRPGHTDIISHQRNLLVYFRNLFKFPGYSGFAELAENSTQQLHLRLPERTRAPYGRVSETSHGTLLGLLSDSEPLPDGRRIFTSDEHDLEAVAARAGRWWITMVTMCGVYFGWDWEPIFRPFDEVQRVLFP